MDVIALGKATKVLKEAKDLDEKLIAPEAESHFQTVDARLDWLEGQASKLQITRTLDVDLSKGIFQNTELNNGIIKLKKIKEVIGQSAEDKAKGAQVISATTDYNRGTLNINSVFDGDYSTYASTSADSNISQVQFKLAKAIKPYQCKITQDGSSNKISGSIMVYGYDESTGSWDKLAPIRQSFSSYSLQTLIFDISTDKYYDTFRYDSGSSSSKSPYTSIRLNEIELFGIEQVITYASSGTYESPIIDLGAFWYETTLIDIKEQLPSADTHLDIYIASSLDGETFSSYQVFAPNQLPQNQFIKFKFELSATPIPGEVNTYSFNQSDDNKVTLNEFVTTNGSLQLTQNYSYVTEDVAEVEGGKVIKTTIPRHLFTKMKSVEVK